MYHAEIITFYWIFKISRDNKTTLQFMIFLMTLFLCLVLLNKRTFQHAALSVHHGKNQALQQRASATTLSVTTNLFLKKSLHSSRSACDHLTCTMKHSHDMFRRFKHQPSDTSLLLKEIAHYFNQLLFQWIQAGKTSHTGSCHQDGAVVAPYVVVRSPSYKWHLQPAASLNTFQKLFLFIPMRIQLIVIFHIASQHTEGEKEKVDPTPWWMDNSVQRPTVEGRCLP